MGPHRPGDRGPAARFETYEYLRDLQLALMKENGLTPRHVRLRVRHLFRWICRTVEPTLFGEIGAHEASFSLWARRRFEHSQVVAFEANPYVYERFAAEVGAAGVDYRHACVTTTNEPVRLHIPLEALGAPRARDNQMGSLRQLRGTEEYESVDVDGVRLDDAVDLGPDDRAVLWIDVEGATEMVLAGAEKVLAATQAIQVEVESEATWDGQWLDVDVVDALADHGFVPVLRDRQRPYQFNLVFVRPELAADPGLVRRVSRAIGTPPKGAART